jgi:hypothetical protein
MLLNKFCIYFSLLNDFAIVFASIESEVCHGNFIDADDIDTLCANLASATTSELKGVNSLVAAFRHIALEGNASQTSYVNSLKEEINRYRDFVARNVSLLKSVISSDYTLSSLLPHLALSRQSHMSTTFMGISQPNSFNAFDDDLLQLNDWDQLPAADDDNLFMLSTQTSQNQLRHKIVTAEASSAAAAAAGTGIETLRKRKIFVRRLGRRLQNLYNDAMALLDLKVYCQDAMKAISETYVNILVKKVNSTLRKTRRGALSDYDLRKLQINLHFVLNSHMTTLAKTNLFFSISDVRTFQLFCYFSCHFSTDERAVRDASRVVVGVAF